jgi:hypothetical protein
MLGYARPIASTSASRKAGAALPPRPRDRPLPAPLVAPGGQRGGEGVQPIVLSGVAAREHPHARRELGGHVHHRLAGRCQPLGQVFAETSGVLDGPTTLAQPFRPTFEGPQAFSRFCGKLAHSMSSPTSPTAARATDALWESTPINTFMRARTSVPVGSLPLIGVREGHSDFGPCSHTSFESLRTPRSPAGRKPRASQPFLGATGRRWRAIPIPAP